MMVVILIFSLINVTTAQKNYDTQVSDELEILEIGSKSGFPIKDISVLLTNSDILPYEFRGVVIIDGKEIAFGVFNNDQLSSNEVLNLIDRELKTAINNYTDENPNVIFNDIKSTLKVKMFSFKDKKSKFEKNSNEIDKEFKNLKEKIKDLKIIKLNQSERQKFFSQFNKKEDTFEDNLVPNVEIVSQELTSEDLLNSKEKVDKKNVQSDNNDAITIQLSDVKGGPAYNGGQCDPTATNPKCGDGQDRLKQKSRFNGSGSVYSWLPVWVAFVNRNLGQRDDRKPGHLDMNKTHNYSLEEETISSATPRGGAEFPFSPFSFVGFLKVCFSR